MKSLIPFIFLIQFFLFSQCEFKGSNTGEDDFEDKKIARVNNTYLLKKELDMYFGDVNQLEDNLLTKQKFINNWVLQQLLFEKSAEMEDFPYEEIRQKVEIYRNELLQYEMKKIFFENYKTKINDTEIQQYYQNDKKNFLLNDIIVKCKLIWIKNKQSENRKIEKLLKSDAPQDLEILKNYCHKNAIHYHLESEKWVNFETVTQNIPLKFIKNKTSFVKKNKQFSKKIKNDRLFFYILDYRLKGQKAPLAFVKEKIKTMILREKSTENIGNFPKKLIEKAKLEDKFEIY